MAKDALRGATNAALDNTSEPRQKNEEFLKLAKSQRKKEMMASSEFGPTLGRGDQTQQSTLGKNKLGGGKAQGNPKNGTGKGVAGGEKKKRSADRSQSKLPINKAGDRSGRPSCIVLDNPRNNAQKKHWKR